MRQQLLDKESVNGKVLILTGLLVFAYVITGALLLGLAFLLYKFRLDEKIINIAIIVIYVFVNFLTGFIAGKKLKVRKFLWGFLLGAGYFIMLAAVSMIVGKQEVVIGSHLLTTFFLCAGGGMLGGMVS